MRSHIRGGAHIHTNTRALEGWPGEATQEGDKLQAGRRESLVPRKLVGERKTMREEGGWDGVGMETRPGWGKGYSGRRGRY